MRILGVDPALTRTGYGVVDFKKNKLSFLEAGVVTTSSRQAIAERLDKIHAAVMRLASRTKPDVIVIEKLFAHYRHPTTAYLLGQARGVICLVCAEKNIPLIEYAATRVKKAVVGRGLGSKLQVQRMVANILNLNKLPKYTDVTDALALAITHSYDVGLRERKLNFNQKVY
ncbi:MAG: crossover junction endodeoxyribonuclease RuvC [Candidatus Omnitrophota bacterium]|nr:MAG: crossover junction endodeoxyribonuclease RuvC [Candidatus Omnitrophota bacterium]